VATASIFVPVASSLAQSIGSHPLGLMIPVGVTCSLAFVLPVSTPPNAMAFASGRLKVSDMVGLGICMNLIGAVVVLLLLYTTGSAIFELGEVPEWATLPDDVGSGQAAHAGVAH
jgi:di/tricarboxylate transporter